MDRWVLPMFEKLLVFLNEYLYEYLHGDLLIIEPGTVLISDLHLNSSRLNDLVDAIDKRFGIKISDDDLPKIIAVQDLAEYLEEKDLENLDKAT